MDASEIKVVLSDDFDTYLVPATEPEHEKFMEYFMAEMAERLPGAEITFETVYSTKVYGAEEERVCELVGEAFEAAYEKVSNPF